MQFPSLDVAGSPRLSNLLEEPVGDQGGERSAELMVDGGAPGGRGPANDARLTREELRLRKLMKLWAASFALEVVLYLWWAWSGPEASRAFAVNSVAKDLTFLVLAVPVIADVRRFGRLMTVIVLGHLAIAASLAALVLTGVTAANFPGTPGSVLGIEFDGGRSVLPIWLLFAAFASAHMWWLHVTARRSRAGLRYLFPLHAETLVALANVVLREPCVTTAEVAFAVDRQWAAFKGKGRNRSRLALIALYAWPLLSARVPFPLLDETSRRRFVDRHFVERGRLLPSAIRAAIRFAIQMVHMGYYSRPETHATTGYTPFSERATPPPKARSALETLDPQRAGEHGLQADVVIVGTGAAGGIVAHCLVEQGHDVLMLERGEFVDPADFTENELEQYSTLYSDGAIQLSRDFAFQILQGRCVGGGTVVNNAVCFDLPQEVLDAWNDDHGAGLPPTLDGSLRAVRELLRVTVQDCAPTSAGVARVVEAVEELGLGAPPSKTGRVSANLKGCVGCGYCNLGCAYGKKLSMLDHVLPQAQRCADLRREQDPSFKGRLRILPTCEVTKIERSGSTASGRRVHGVTCVVGAQRRPLSVTASTVVVAAGAIHSSRLLQRSRIGGGQAGRGLCANIATFMTGDFPEEIRGFAGLQLATFVEPPHERGYVLESWFNPPVITALSMPGWLERHQLNMSRYDHIMCLGVLVGTSPRKANKVRRFTLGADFAFEPSEGELKRLAEALAVAGRILFAAGATRVMPSTFDYHEFTSPDELDDLERILLEKGNASLQSSHPQGGNAVGADPSTGVVDPTFRVHGYDNLYVCDASVFPTATTVNPQLSVMAIAHHAATHPDGLGGLAT